jgi:ribulose-phosphate 3-epimerase
LKKIAPSILSADFSILGDEVRAVEKAGADLIHIDVMDGRFVPNITIGPSVVQAVRKVTTLPFDVHLMVESPEDYIAAFAAAGSNIITVHAEAARHLHRTVEMIKEKGVKAGVSLNPATSLVQVEEILPYVDLLLVMTVNPGFGGQKFITGMLKKIREAKHLVESLSAETSIEVDGGITVRNIGAVSEAGADIFVAGASVFTSGDYAATIGMMKDILKGRASC